MDSGWWWQVLKDPLFEASMGHEQLVAPLILCAPLLLPTQVLSWKCYLIYSGPRKGTGPAQMLFVNLGLRAIFCHVRAGALPGVQCPGGGHVLYICSLELTTPLLV